MRYLPLIVVLFQLNPAMAAPAPELVEKIEQAQQRADHHHTQFQFEESERARLQEIELREQALGANHRTVALRALGHLYSVWARVKKRPELYGKSEKTHQKGIANLEAVVGSKSCEVAHSKVYLARLYMDLDRMAEVQPTAEQAFEVLLEVPGPQPVRLLLRESRVSLQGHGAQHVCKKLLGDDVRYTHNALEDAVLNAQALLMMKEDGLEIRLGGKSRS